MISRASLVIFLFMLHFPVLAEMPASDTPAVEEALQQQDIIDQQALIDIEQIKTDEEILQSLDNFGDQLGNEIFAIEQQATEGEIPAQQQALQALDQIEQEQLDEEPIRDDDIMMDNSFDDLDLGMILEEEDFSELKTPVKPELFDSKAATIKKSSELGVGVAGKEEKLINKLDKSDLMDFENQVDVWSKDVVEDIEIEDLL